MSLGLGSAIVALSASPAFVIIRPVLEHKAWVFAISGTMLALNAWVIYRWLPRRACAPGTVCAVRPPRSASALFWISVAVFAASLFLSYGLVPVLEMVDHVRGE